MLCCLLLTPAAVLPVRVEADPDHGGVAVSAAPVMDDSAQKDDTEERSQVRIAFIDSGISTKHIDSSRVLEGVNYMFPESDTQDRVGHGTATAGLVLGAEEQGVTGICPDALAIPLVVVDTYPSGAVKNGGPDALCKAIYDAVDRYNCRVINISLCTTEDSAELRAAVDHAEAQGVILVAAVGNDGEDGQTYYPAAYETVIAVGSATEDMVARFSQSGADILAEGTDLLTATNRNAPAPVVVSGTSYSCALISGICARLVTADPQATPETVRKALYSHAKDLLESGYDARSGWGVISAYQDDWYSSPDALSRIEEPRLVLAGLSEKFLSRIGYGVLQNRWCRNHLRNHRRYLYR